MSRYPLHTTGDLNCLPLYVKDSRRRAVWIHVTSDDERAWAQDVIIAAGWRIMPRLPSFFVVGYRPELLEGDVNRLRGLVFPEQEPDDVEFMGRMFGYSEKEIHWYMREIGIGKRLRKTT